MNDACRAYAESILAVAFGGTAEPEFDRHLSKCENCRTALADYRTIASSMTWAFDPVPRDLADRAIAVMAAQDRRPLVARLIPWAAGATRALPSASIARRFELPDGAEANVLCERSRRGWRVMAEAPSWRLAPANAETQPGPAIEFEVERLVDAAIHAERGDVFVVIPAPDGDEP